MPIIKLPDNMPAEFNPDGSLKNIELNAEATIREAVLTLPFWKDGADLKLIDACLEIESALDLNSAAPVVSTETRNCLKDAMQLKLPNGNFGSVTNSRSNRFYMRIMRAVLTASES